MDVSFKRPPSEQKQDPLKARQNQRYALYFLSFLAGGVLILWIWQLNYRLSEPFQPSLAVDPASADDLLAEVETVDLRLRDTDNDGLNDYDELYVHNTSPYLFDTDGDGVSDYDEIFVYRTDPLCPQGQDCSGGNLVNPEANPDYQLSAIDTIGDNLDLNYLQPGQEIGDDYEGMIGEALSGQADPLALRQLLLEGGLDPNLINQLSDEDLMNIYQEILNNQTSPNSQPLP